ncbi:MAG: sulfite exporter TauE/SafE family protein [Myxococcales bacterium]|nr:sulfite exporter TauE/SafE family protein [Myxococcales bacterium]
MLALAALLSVAIGVTVGLLGGGGSILTLPLLVYLLHVETKAAIASSLLLVGTTSLVGAVSHARAGNVQARAGAVFGAAAMGGAFAGGRMASLFSGAALLLVFACVMLVTALAMMRPRADAEGASQLALGRVLAAGVAVGLVAGLVGAGGGFLVVPALVFFGGLAMRQAVGTSLMVIALQSFAGLLGHLRHTQIDLRVTGILTVAAVAGSLVGARLAAKAPAKLLRAGFAWLVLAMALFMLGKQLGYRVPLVVAPFVGVLALYLARPRRTSP